MTIHRGKSTCDDNCLVVSPPDLPLVVIQVTREKETHYCYDRHHHHHGGGGGGEGGGGHVLPNPSRL